MSPADTLVAKRPAAERTVSHNLVRVMHLVIPASGSVGSLPCPLLGVFCSYFQCISKDAGCLGPSSSLMPA